ncbi:hypothetical protein ACH42_01235 [Endozoicomonas sp. (ex Bugula neritina AB1)]|nr:hypothetical protein ACH42_01235 [Endozoicomonas sp. (ex Bugula neritina AB1)]
MFLYESTQAKRFFSSLVFYLFFHIETSSCELKATRKYQLTIEDKQTHQQKKYHAEVQVRINSDVVNSFASTTSDDNSFIDNAVVTATTTLTEIGTPLSETEPSIIYTLIAEPLNRENREATQNTHSLTLSYTETETETGNEIWLNRLNAQEPTLVRINPSVFFSDDNTSSTRQSMNEDENNNIQDRLFSFSNTSSGFSPLLPVYSLPSVGIQCPVYKTGYLHSENTRNGPELIVPIEEGSELRYILPSGNNSIYARKGFLSLEDYYVTFEGSAPEEDSSESGSSDVFMPTLNSRYFSDDDDENNTLKPDFITIPVPYSTSLPK